jgi:hypothetical protein
MDSVLLLHVLSAAALLVVSGSVFVWGTVRARRVTLGGPKREDKIFTQVAALVQTMVIAVGLLGLLLIAGDNRPDDRLHATVYGPFMLLAVIGTYSYRSSDPRWNVRVASIASFFILALGVRAFVTG